MHFCWNVSHDHACHSSENWLPAQGSHLECFSLNPQPGVEFFTGRYEMVDPGWPYPALIHPFFVTVGYIEAAVIPAGARRIRVVEDKPAHSFLGKKTREKMFWLKFSSVFFSKWPFSKQPVRFVAAREGLVILSLAAVSAFEAWFHDVCDVIVCDTYRPCATCKDQRVLLYTDTRVPEQNLAVDCTELPGAHSTSGGSGEESCVFREGNGRGTDRKAPGSVWSRGRIADIPQWPAAISYSSTFSGCCTQDLILHSEMSFAAASSPLASVLSGKKICLILSSFLLLHSFRGEQAPSPPFPVGKKGLDIADG